MKLSTRAIRILFYAVLAGAALFLCVTITFKMFDAARDVTGMSAGFLASMLCIVPIVLGGIALARESGSAP